MPRRSHLLTVDGIANLLFGVAVLAFPEAFFQALACPGPDTASTRPLKIKVCHQPECTEEDLNEDDEHDDRGSDKEDTGPLEDLLVGFLDFVLGGLTLDANFCDVAPNGSSCFCSRTETDCIFGIDNGLELHDVLVLRY